MNSILNVKEKPVLEFTDTIKIEDLLRASQCFPRIYWSLVWRYLLIYSFIPLIFGAYFRSLIIFIIVLFIIGLYVLVKIKLEYNKILTKEFTQKYPEKEYYTNEYSFYSDYFIMTNETQASKYYYKDFTKFIETNLNIHLENKKLHIVITFNKSECPLELIPLLKEKLINLEKNPQKKIFNISDKKKSNAILTILFVLSILSIYGALFCVLKTSGNKDPLDMERNMWILYTWLPIPLLSIIMGFRYQQSNENSNKNIIVGILVSIFLLIFGSFSFLFNDDLSFEYDTIMNINRSRELHMNISYPGNLGLKTSNYKVTIVTYQSDEIPTIEEQIKNNSHWLKLSDIKEYLKDNLPSKLMTSKDAYYLIYNKTSNEYNSILEGENEIEVIIFNPSTYSLEIHTFTLEK